jgi:hypothetical protein
MGPRNAYKDMLDNVVSPITCVSMKHQNHLEQMANQAMFATASSPTTAPSLDPWEETLCGVASAQATGTPGVQKRGRPAVTARTTSAHPRCVLYVVCTSLISAT